MPRTPRFARIAIITLLALASARTAQSQSPHELILEEQYRSRLQAIADSTHGVVGAMTIDLVSGRAVGINDSLIFPQGSAIKIPILIELYRQLESGQIALSERLPVRRADQVGGSGILQRFEDGSTSLSPHDLAVLMIVLSDNTATNMLIDRVGGFDSVNSTMSSLDVGQIRLQRRMIKPLESARGAENLATPTDAARLMQRLATCALPVSQSGCEEVRRILELPKSGSIPASVPGNVRVAWKPGGVEGVQTAWGIVELPARPYVVVGMVTYADGDEASAALRSIADAAYEYHRRLARASRYGVRVPLTVADSIRPQ